MAELTEEQITLIEAFIQQQGLKGSELHDELLDHICSQMESRMDEGADFEGAFVQSLELFGPGGLRQVQLETFELLTEMNETMKNVTFGFGLTSILLLLAGTIFKWMHWPGAGIMITLGAGLLTLFYLPLVLRHKMKESPPNERLLHLSGYVGLSASAIGALFKIMHWPGGNILLITGLAMMALVYVPMYYYRKYQQSSNKAITLTTALLAMSCLVMVFALTRMQVNDYDHGISAVQLHLAESAELAGKNSSLYERLGANKEAMRLKKESQNLSDYLEELKYTVIAETEQISMEDARHVPIHHFKRNRDYGKALELLFADDSSPYSAKSLSTILSEYKQEVMGIYPIDLRTEIAQLFPIESQKSYDFEGRDWSWEEYHFFRLPQSGIITQLDKLRNDVRQAENQALIYLISQPKVSDPPS